MKIWGRYHISLYLPTRRETTQRHTSNLPYRLNQFSIDTRRVRTRIPLTQMWNRIFKCDHTPILIDSLNVRLINLTFNKREHNIYLIKEHNIYLIKEHEIEPQYLYTSLPTTTVIIPWYTNTRSTPRNS